MPYGWTLVVALVLGPVAALSAPLPWMTDFSAALEKARAERKLLVVYSSSAECDACVRFEQLTLGHPSAPSALSHFVPLRILSDSTLANQNPVPANGLWVLDPEGTIVTALGLPSASLLNAHLSYFRVSARPLIAGIDAIAEGRVYEGRMMKGQGLRAVGAVKSAVRELELARAVAEQEGRASDAQRATIAMAETLAEDELREGATTADSQAILQRMMREAADPEIRGEAFTSLVSVHRWSASHDRIIGTIAEGLETAPPGSPLEREARAASGHSTVPDGIVLLLPPAPLLGKGPVAAAARDPRIERVQFRVDGKVVAQARNRPFQATIDLGPRPSRRRIEAVGLDRSGAALSRHSLQVNLAETFFELELLPFRTDGLEVIVEAVPTLGPARRIERVDFYLNDERHASASRPPYRVRMPRQAWGFVRASAVAPNGTTKEDIRFFDPESVDQSFRLNLVEILVNVEDRARRPVLDLSGDEFRIREGRQTRAVRSARQLSTDPLMAGIAIDRSKSLHGFMDRVATSALRFTERATRGGEVFVVGFHHRPEILQASTSRVEALRRTLADLEASGNTALNEALIFSLMQFENASGNRFLLVLTDGIDTSSRYDQKVVERIANEFGVPIYFVFFDSAEARADPARLAALRAIAEGTGGRAFDLTSIEELDAIWNRIQIDVDSRYLLTYLTPLDPSEWRPIQISTERADARVRSVRGLTPALTQ
jgi:VWFA-related protein